MNTITSTYDGATSGISSYGIKAGGTLTISGSGELTVIAGSATDGDSIGIFNTYATTIKSSANVIATGGTSTDTTPVSADFSSIGVNISSPLKVQDTAMLTATGSMAARNSFGVDTATYNSDANYAGDITLAAMAGLSLMPPTRR